MSNWSGLAEPIIWGLLSILTLMLAWKQDTWPDWLRWFLIFAGALFAIAFALILGNWIWSNANTRLTEFREAMAITPQSKQLQVIAAMKPEAYGVLNQYVPIVKILAGLPGPIRMLVTPNGDVPEKFIREFVRRSSDTKLASVRQWSEGSREHNWADGLTALFMTLGFATRKEGEVAEWTDKRSALKAVGMIQQGALGLSDNQE